MTDADLKTRDALTKCLSLKMKLACIGDELHTHTSPKRTTAHVELFHSPIGLFLPFLFLVSLSLINIQPKTPELKRKPSIIQLH